MNIFEKIITREIPSDIVYEDEMCLAFRDVNPQAPVHVLIIPKMCVPSTNDITTDNALLVSHIFAVIPKLAAELGLTNGYRVVNNCGADGGQTVEHLHFHLLGGRAMDWPPG